MDFYQALYHIMAYDAGGRGLRGPLPDLPGLGRSLLRCRRALLVTGFPVLRPGMAPVGETDGPVGTAELAAALEALGCRVTVATDAPSFPLVRSALTAAGAGAETVCLPRQGAGAFAQALLRRASPDHLIALERPGRAADGHFHNMRGDVLDGAVADSDLLFALARRRGAVTVAVGDGGNELGLGALRAQVAACVPHGGEIAAVQTADYTLTAGVSNWWGAGLAALASYETGRALLFSQAQEAALLEAVSAAGGVDGCTGAHTLTVDGLPLPVHQGRRAALADLLRRCCRQARTG